MTPEEKQINRKANKLFLVFFLIFALIASLALNSNAQQPFAGKTKHKTVKRMSKRQVKNAKKCNRMYVWKRGKLRKR